MRWRQKLTSEAPWLPDQGLSEILCMSRCHSTAGTRSPKSSVMWPSASAAAGYLWEGSAADAQTSAAEAQSLSDSTN